MSNAPLAGIRVLDLSRILAGPVCCQVLGDLGADVVKIERPGAGDDTRAWGPPFVGEDGPSAYYLSCNRNKRSLALDLSHPGSREVLDELIRRADVLVENFLPKDVERFGLSPARLAELNPRLVSCSISGYGRTGPLADVPGYDLMVQATAGLMSITGEPTGAPMKVGVALSDIITGLYAAIAALAGLHARGKSAQGESFDLALADCTLASLVNVVQGALVSGERPRRYGNAHPQIVPYEVFATADGHLVLAVGNDRQWREFCDLAGVPGLGSDARFGTNPARVRSRSELIPRLNQLLAGRTTSQWLAVLKNSGVPHSPVLAVDEALASPQFGARDMIQEATDSAGRRYRLIGTPLHWPGRGDAPLAVPPALGEQTDDVLRDWLNCSVQEIADLRRQGVIG